MAVYAHINTFPHGSTGGIMMKEHRELLAKGEESYAFWGRGRNAENDHEMRFATDFEFKRDALETRLGGKAGFRSIAATKRLLRRLDELKPDVVHLHNLHGYYVNVGMLFEWLAAHECRVEWTLHDCWAFTGHCAYSENCSQLNTYPKTFAGSKSCRWNFEQKKRVFNLVPAERMRLITPSHWLEGLVKQSFLSEYPIEVRHNTIDKTVFKPTPSDFRERYGIGDRLMILGVASPWTERKGLPGFIRLAKELDSDHFVVVLVGLSKEQIKQVQRDVLNVIALPKTGSVQELAEAYTAADVFFNPTTEDNYPTVNLEAEACGTRVVTYDTGGCRETVRSADSHVVDGYEQSLALLYELGAKA